VAPVHLDVWSDYLCPWCNVASVRMHKLLGEFGSDLTLTWRSFLLRPAPEPNRDLEKFRRYTEGWQRAAAEEPDALFRVWSSDEGPPSHSVPAHLVAKAAGTFGDDAFLAMHARLLHAYFAENRDISNARTLAALWRDVGFADAELERATDPRLLRLVGEEHNQAIELGVNGVPAVRMEGNDVAISGAQPIEIYRRWIRRALDGATT